MQNEERINGLENKVRELEEVICAMKTELPAEPDAHSDLSDEELANNNGVTSLILAFIAGYLISSIVNCMQSS